MQLCKKFFSIIFISATLFSVPTVIFSAARPEKTMTKPMHLTEDFSKRLAACTPSNTVIAFDLHGVLFSLKTAQAVWAGITGIPWSIGRVVAGSDLKSAFKEAANCQQPQENVWQAVRALKKAGYQLFIFSNITEPVYVDLRGVFTELSLFDGVCVAPGGKENIQKPEPAAYDRFREFLTVRGQGNKEIVFFDDGLLNVEAGCKKNFLAFYYSPQVLTQITEQLIVQAVPTEKKSDSAV